MTDHFILQYYLQPASEFLDFMIIIIPFFE